ncbi:MAG: peptidoglycan-binding domain-containing protein, partial [Gammaproteobacteria bacterium]
MHFRSVAASLVLAAGIATGMVATATPASALPTCLGMSVYYDGFDTYERPTTANNTKNINCVLGVGSRGEPVVYLQLALRTCYGQPIAVDGIFGSQTRNAVMNVQRFHRIRIDG